MSRNSIEKSRTDNALSSLNLITEQNYVNNEPKKIFASRVISETGSPPEESYQIKMINVNSGKNDRDSSANNL